MAAAIAIAPTPANTANTAMDTRFNNQYFIYTLIIKPTDSKNIEFTGKVKAHIEANLDWVTQKLECYKNDDAVKIGFSKYSTNFHSKTLLSIADLYYTDFVYNDIDTNTNYNIHMVFYCLKKEELFTKSVINNDTVIMNLLYRDCLIRNNITDDDTHKHWNLYAQDNLIKDLAAERIMDLSFIPPEYCKTKHYIHQLDMIASYLKIHYNYETMRFTSDRVFYLGNMMRLWFNYTHMKDNDAFFHDSEFPTANIIGGIDCTHTGHGKTYCALTYAIYVGMNDPTHKTKTLICVPDHIKDHWYSQLAQHFVPGDYSPYITIASYTDVANMDSSFYNSHTVFIGDELHLLYGKIENRALIYDKITNSDNFQRRWGITATPSTSDGHSLFHIIRLIIRKFDGRPITHPAAGRYKYILDEIKTHGLLRRNVEATTKTYLNLPPVTIHNVPCVFSQEEWDFYFSEMSADTNRNIMDIMKFCVDLMVMMMDTTTNKNITTVSKWKEHAFNTRVEQANTCREVLIALTNKLENVLNEIKKHKSQQMNQISQSIINDYEHRAHHIISEIKAQEVIVASRNAVVERYRATLANLEASVEKCDSDVDTSEDTFDEDKICSICYEPYYGVIAMFPTITDSFGNVRCGHYFHKRCYEDYRRTTQTNNCPMCRSVAEAGSITYVGRSEEKRIIGAKNKKIIELMTVNHDQSFIIFTHFENYIPSLRSLLSSNEISNMDYDEYAIDKTRLGGAFPNVRALILSSNKNACGIDLQEFHNIIIVSPFLNNVHGKQVEKQLIGRCDRIGQTHEINVYRLYIVGTIEADLYHIKPETDSMQS
jgi:hypothetical protein